MPIVTKICELVNKTDKPDWWRYTLNTAILKGKLSQVELEDAYRLAKMEFGLEAKSEQYSNLVKSVKATGYQAESEENKLVSISNAKNVSALATGKKIEFSQTGLTVIYGNNGTGKSSYAKILKNACLTRGEAPEIKANVFTDTEGFPSAEIQISSAGQIETINWSSTQSPCSKLKSIRVFDSNSSVHYLSKSDPLDFKPPALKLLDELVKVSAHINTQIKRDEIVYSSNAVIPEMYFGTEPSKLVISSKLSEEKVESLCATEEELIELAQLRTDVLELSRNTPETLKAKYKKRRLRLIPLQTFLININNTLSDENVTLYKLNYTQKENLKTTATKLSKSTFSELPIANIGSEEWLTMWKAVGKFLKSTDCEAHFPPKEGEFCPACLQQVNSSSADRLESFNKYLQSQLQKEAEKYQKAWRENKESLQVLNFSVEPYAAILSEIEDKSFELKTLFDEMIKSLSERAIKLLGDKPTFDFGKVNLRAVKWLSAQIESLLKNENDIQDDASLKAALSNRNLKIKEIEDRNKILTTKNLILTEIKKAKKRDAYLYMKRSTSTTSITKLINEICRSGEIGKMQEFFDLELDKLGFKNFSIKTLTKGSKGVQNFSIKLPDCSAKLLDIASEGEQKCISLASFFAELEADSRRSAIIFDDPVNSLDHIWRQRFATRIAKESERRQVIVLTHDLPFLKMIQESSAEITVRAITRNKSTTGIPLERPPWDALKTQSRIGILKDKLVSAKKANAVSFEEYQAKASIIYGKKRETWERLVEEWLIRGVVERFNREIKTQSVRYLSDIQDADISTINSAMGKCSTYMNGHDMAEEVAGFFPDVDELERDISDLDTYFKALKARRK